MKYWFLLVLLWAGSRQPSSAQRLSYAIRADKHTPNALRVALTYDTADTTATVFRYANDNWGETALGACLLEVQANVPVQRKTVGDWVLLTAHHRPRQQVRLRYLIRPDRTDTLRYERTYRPIMEQGYFHVYGFGLFVQPTRYWTKAAAQQAVRVRWQLPPEWHLLTSFAPQTARRVVVQGRASLLESSVFAGGALQVRALPAGRGPVWLATRPFQNLVLDSAARHLQVAVRAQRTFWRDSSQASLAVTLLPTYERQPADLHRRHVSVSGTALLQSFSAFATDNAGPVIAERVDYLFFHELMHQWIGKQIRIRHEERQYWFSEGFTEYFQTQLRLHTQVVTPAQYVQEINRDFVQALYHSPVRNAPNDSITHHHFWTNQDYEKLPYRRGFLFALYLDTHLKQTTPYSLADCLRLLLARSYTTHKQGFTDPELLALIREVTGFDPTPAYQRYIQQGQAIDFAQASLPPGLRVQPAPDATPLFELAPAQSEAFYQFMVR
ncbi:MAG: M1 family aminopeptidase [Janthinobacterium lividum]